MTDPIMAMVNINVTFDVSKVTTGEQPISMSAVPAFLNVPLLPPQTGTQHGFNVEQGIALIVFELQTTNQGDGPEAQFPTYPIEWFEPPQVGATFLFNTPIAQPDCFQVHWYNPRQCTIVDTNTALSQNQHPFNVLVSYENQTYGTDPVIVNMPPDG
jgi:hypothetical protein